MAAPLATASAFAATPPAPGARSVTASHVTEPVTEVDRFFKAYRHAVLGVGSRTPAEVRKAHLAEELDTRLTEWAEEHHADPVLRAQNVPESWRVRRHATTATTATVIVTQVWGAAPDTEVWYTVRRSDLKITDLTDPPIRR
jgi:hypothetical protein